MIDQQLIDQNTATLIVSVTTAKRINSQLNLITSVFTPSLLTKLETYFVERESSELWVPETTMYNVPMSDRPRHKLTWEAESVIEELHEVCNNLTDTVHRIYPTCTKPFCGIVIWRDREGYDIKWHTDNPVVDVTLQVYLSGSEKNPGTEFEVGDGTVTAPFIPNTGYIVQHAGEKRPRHQIAYPVPAGETRYSLFAIWGDRF